MASPRGGAAAVNPLAMSIRPHSIHHINFPITDVERARDWYARVFGMQHVDVSRFSDTPILLMTYGNFDLHFTPHDDPQDLKPTHFCLEVDDWDEMLAWLDAEGIPYEEPVTRPQNGSVATYIQDPDGNLIELFQPAHRTGAAPTA